MARQLTKARRVSVDDTKPASANYHANALARGVALLEMIAERRQALTLTDFSTGTSLPKSTLVRLLAVLTEMEYVVRVDDRPSYRLGHKVQRLSTAYVSTLDLTEVAGPYLRPVAMTTGQTANLGMLDAEQVLHVCVAEPNRPLRFTTAPGSRDNAYCTGLGKLLLSQLPVDDVPHCVPAEPFPAFTGSTITTLDALRRDLRRTNRRGFALDDSEGSSGLRCVAVPVRLDERCVAAISVSGPAGEFGTAQQHEYVAALHEVATALAADPEVAAALRMTQRSLRVPGDSS